MLGGFAGAPANCEAAAAPAEASLAFAALQVCWTRMAGDLLQPEGDDATDRVRACPVCGSPPLASLVHARGSLAGSRFLVCSLCATEWHLVRIKCTNCHSTKGIAYLEIEGVGAPVKAETCDECRTYTKIIYTEKAVCSQFCSWWFPPESTSCKCLKWISFRTDGNR